MRAVPFKEEGSTPPYTITSQTPQLSGGENEAVARFNALSDQIVQVEIANFRENSLSQASDPPIASGSFFDATYDLVYQNGNLWSLKFDFLGYSDGAAHPYHYSKTLNYDLERRMQLSLDDLFLANSEYLQALSDYCITELSQRDIGFDGAFSAGAEPTPENYRNWNIASDGLLITFDEYQVASYAAGPQTVVVPYDALRAWIAPLGPLRLIMP
ncbi:MAG TPA: RsiV family protein [Anaerolineales bacterium]|nr:RsiV family protein [Anaerolineales bacterium]